MPTWVHGRSGRGSPVGAPAACCALLLFAALLVPRAVAADEGQAPRFGLQLDAGLPDGAAAALVVRPLRALRLDAGLTYNLIGFGLRGGVTLVPWRLPVAPSLRLEAGHTFEADASSFIGNFTTLGPGERRALERFSYDYASAQAGLELGNPDRWLFFVRAGLAWVWAGLSGFDAAAREAEPSVRSAADPSATGRSVTASAGFVFFFG